jgi:hypothetical protein
MNKSNIGPVTGNCFTPNRLLPGKYYSDRAVHMPRRYFYDSVAVIENGKTINDTLWHKVKYDFYQPVR